MFANILKGYHLHSRISSLKLVSKAMAHQWSTPREIRIPMTFGFTAAKAWGNETSEPVLALHGWQDNAGTFDTLIPLLRSDLFVVAIDSPGHGQSSHLPPGAFYDFISSVVYLKQVVDHFKWETFSIIGHSMGGQIASMFASLYPEKVKGVVLLDIVKPASRDRTLVAGRMRNGVESLIATGKKVNGKVPVYTVEGATTRLCAGTYDQVTPESAGVLLRRGTKKSESGTGLVFSRDIRVRNMDSLLTFSHDELKAYLSEMRSDLLIVKASNSAFFQSATPEVLPDFIKLYREKCRSVEIVEVEGNHFVHLNNPERVAPHVDAFFKKCLQPLSKI